MLKIVNAKVSAYGGEAGDAYIGEVVVVELETESGLVGTGFASAPRGVGHIFRDLIANVLAPQIIGANAMLHRDLWERMFRTIPRRGGETMTLAYLMLPEKAGGCYNGRLCGCRALRAVQRRPRTESESPRAPPAPRPHRPAPPRPPRRRRTRGLLRRRRR